VEFVLREVVREENGMEMYTHGEEEEIKASLR